MAVPSETQRRRGPSGWAYASGVAVSLVVLATLVAAVTAREERDAGLFVEHVRLVVGFGIAPAAALGGVGSLVLAAFGLVVPSQAWHVVVAGCMGWAIGLVLFGPVAPFTVSLATAAVCGRLVLVPHVRARRRAPTR